MVRKLLLAGALALAVSPSIQAADPAADPASEAAATDTGAITGSVRTPGGDPVAGATVTLLCSCLDAPRKLTTGKDGTYTFDGLPAGMYSLRVQSGKTDIVRHIEVVSGGRVDARVDLPGKKSGKKSKKKSSKKSGSAKKRKALTKKRVTPSAPKKRLETKYKNERDVDAILNPSAAPRYARRKAARAHSIRSFSSSSPISARALRAPIERPNTEGYAHIDENDFRSVADAPLSTFSADVDTASYSNMRRFLNEGRLPPKDAVRIEELINYFDYDYAIPSKNNSMAVDWELGPCPWNDEHQLVHIGLKTRPISNKKAPPRNLVFLLDVSGSMQSANKLPLLQRSMELLVDQLREQDTISIVVYAGSSGLVLPPTSGSERRQIKAAIASLEAGGSTNGAAGIRLAYQMAQHAFIKKGINRVILATDGDFNVGTTSHGDLTRMVEDKRKTGVFLSVLGFGMGNVKDDTMELLADKGNGNYAYIDDIAEGRRVLVEQAGATLQTVAKDVKLQVEFNPEKIAEYRLVGYENRRLRNEDFNDDTKDAGDMGAGHTVTVLYELVPANAGKDRGKPKVDPLKYQDERTPSAQARSGEWMTVKIRFKKPDGDKSRLLEVPVRGAISTLSKTSNDFRFSAAVAQMGMLLRDSPHRGSATFDRVAAQARKARGTDPHGYRKQFISLVGKAKRLE